MIVNISEAGGDVMLAALAGALNGGSIELLSDDGELLVTLGLSNPAGEVVNGELHFDKIFQGDAVKAGVAVTARVLTNGGDEVLSCDCGPETSDAVVRLNNDARINRGSPVKLHSFRLIIP